MTERKYPAMDFSQLWLNTSDSDKSEVPPTPDDNDEGGGVPTEPDEVDDNGRDPIELVVEHLFWFQRGATVPMISRRNDIPEDIVQECIDEIIEDGYAEATEVEFQSERWVKKLCKTKTVDLIV